MKNNLNALFHLQCINVCIIVEELTPEELQDTVKDILTKGMVFA